MRRCSVGRVGWAAWTAAVVVVAFVSVVSQCDGWSTKDWYPHIGRGPSFSETAFVSVDMGTAEMEGRVMALGDMDGDSYTDVFVVTKGIGHSLDTVKVYRWNYWDYAFEAMPFVDVTEPDIRNVILSDFNRDGRLDILIQGGSSEAMLSNDSASVSPLGRESPHLKERDLKHSESDSTLPYLRIYFGDYQSLTEPVTLPLAPDLSAYDILASAVDINGDMAVDLYLQRTYWVNEGNGRLWRVVSQFEDDDKHSSIALRHSNGLADITGDCFPDLLLFSSRDGVRSRSIAIDADSRHYERIGQAEYLFSVNNHTIEAYDETSDASLTSDVSSSSVNYDTTAEAYDDASDKSLTSDIPSDSYEIDDSWYTSESSGEVMSSDDVHDDIDESSAEYSTTLSYTSSGTNEYDEDDSVSLVEDEDHESDSSGVHSDVVDEENVSMLEVWTFSHHKYTLSDTFRLPSGTGRATFADMDGDGALDVLFTECSPAPTCEHHNKVHIAFNVQPKVCEGVTSVGSDCIATDQLCSVSEWSLPDMSVGEDNENIVIVASDTFGGWRFVWDESVVGALSAPRMGDYNLDGYPDMLIVVLDDDGDRQLQLLENVECTESLCGKSATDAKRRTLQRVLEGVDALETVVNVVDATFFDVDEDGDLDMLYNARDDDDQVGRERIGLLYNSMHIDSMFLKAMGSNGVCPQWCTDGEKFPNPKPVGVNHPGATFKYTMTDGAGKRRSSISTQLSQTASGLQLPYCLFGLGRTSSYVDYLFMGIGADTNADWYYSWQGVIPNAQVAIFPYPYTTPASWFMLMYIHPSGIFFWVVVACVVCCAALGAIYLALHRREQLQDKKEVEQQAHLFL